MSEEPSVSKASSPEKVHVSPGSYSNINTIRNTQWSLNTWNEWRIGINSKKEIHEKLVPSLVELSMLPLDEMDKLLKQFIEEIQTPDGNDYPPDSIRNILYGIQRHIRLTIPDINLFEKHSKTFQSFQIAYSKKIKEITSKGINLKKRQAQAISDDLEKQLWDKGAFRFHHAIGLSNAVFFYTCKVFGIIAGDSLRKLDMKHFKFEEDEHGKYLELSGQFVRSVSCRHYKCGMDPANGSIRQYQDVNNQRCYYNLMVHYFKQIKRAQLTGPLFLKPLQDKCFSNQALGENNLSSKLGHIMKTHEIDGYYTNHSINLAVAVKFSSKGLNLRKLYGSTWTRLEVSQLLDPPPGVVNETEAVLLPCINQISTSTCTPTTGPFFLQQQGSQIVLQHKQNLFPQTIMSSLSVPLAPSAPVQKALLNKIKPHIPCVPIQPKIKTEIPEDQFDSTPHQTLQTTTVFPLYLSAADSTSMSFEGQGDRIQEGQAADKVENDLSPAEHEEVNTIIHKIKEEPIDDYDYSVNLPITPQKMDDYEPENSNDTNISEMSATISSSDHIKQESKSPNTKKRKFEHTEESGDTVQEKPKVKGPYKEPMSINVAEVVLSFSKNQENGILKQEVGVKDNDQDVFTSSSTYKTGRPIPNFDLTLGDYLPENCVIRPSDIKIKRVATPNGGKMVLHVKYSNTDD